MRDAPAPLEPGLGTTLVRREPVDAEPQKRPKPRLGRIVGREDVPRERRREELLRQVLGVFGAEVPLQPQILVDGSPVDSHEHVKRPLADGRVAAADLREQ